MSKGRLLVEVCQTGAQDDALGIAALLREQSRLARRGGRVVVYHDGEEWGVAVALSPLDTHTIVAGGARSEEALERFARFVRHADAAAPVGALEDDLTHSLPGMIVTIATADAHRADLFEPSRWDGSAGRFVHLHEVPSSEEPAPSVEDEAETPT